LDDSIQPGPVGNPIELDCDWTEFHVNRNAQVRARIIERFLPFARMLAAKAYAKRTYLELEFQDYLQYATIGLVESVDRFVPDFGAKFETFSAPRITGAILNGIESLSEKQQQISARKRAIAARLDSVKSSAPKVNTTDALFAYLAQVAVGLAVGFALEDSGMYQAEIEPVYADNTYQRVELKQLQRRILSLVNLLPRNERSVITYHYLQHLAFGEIAAILGLTKGRVSQIHREALQKLKASIRIDGAVDLSF
jgi:RNA polymerase sigma factor for flagellar operon FliA